MTVLHCKVVVVTFGSQRFFLVLEPFCFGPANKNKNWPEINLKNLKDET